uniref:hypothetical protein n=1 Tax=Phytohalomonas tamaricis TaxID=2081032 RepID=UPI000D0B8867|nr:hypothetical protein [Phytohalomonas tamaricis]
MDTQRNILVANYSDTVNYSQLLTREQAEEHGLAPLGAPGGSSDSHGAAPQAGTPYGVDINAGWRNPTDVLCNQPPYGGIMAIDMNTREGLWDVPLGTARKNGSFGIPTYLPLKIGTPNNGGSVVTAGGLIFIAAATDDLIRAIDIDTGETAWQHELPAGGHRSLMGKIEKKMMAEAFVTEVDRGLSY